MLISKKFLLNINLLGFILFIISGNILIITLPISFIRTLPVRLTDLFVAIGVLLFVFKYRFNYKEVKCVSYFGMWIVWAVFGLLFNILQTSYTVPQILTGAFYLVRLIMYLIFIFFLVNYFSYMKVTPYEMFLIYIYSYTVVCVLGFFQLKFFPDAVSFNKLLLSYGVYIPVNYDPHSNRLTSTYIDPNYLASMLNLSIVLALSVYISTKKLRYLIVICIQIIALFLTVSRTGLIGLFVSLVVFLLISLKIKFKTISINKNLFCLFIFVMSISLFMITVSDRLVARVVNFSTDSSALARFNSWSNGMEVVYNKFLIGIGYNMIGIYNTYRYGTNINSASAFGNNSSVITILISTGIIGCFVYLYSLSSTITDLKKCCHRTTGEEYFAKALITILITTLVTSNFNNLLFYPLYFYPIMFLVAYYTHYNYLYS